MRINAMEDKIYWFLCDKATQKGGDAIQLAYSTIAQYLHLEIDEVRAGIQSLAGKKMLRIERTDRANIYHMRRISMTYRIPVKPPEKYFFA